MRRSEGKDFPLPHGTRSPTAAGGAPRSSTRAESEQPGAPCQDFFIRKYKGKHPVCWGGWQYEWEGREAAELQPTGAAGPRVRAHKQHRDKAGPEAGSAHTTLHHRTILVGKDLHQPVQLPNHNLRLPLVGRGALTSTDGSWKEQYLGYSMSPCASACPCWPPQLSY